MPTLTVTPEFLALISGAVLSLLFSYVPKLNTWFAGLDSGIKQLLMAVILLVVVIAIFLMGCFNLAVIPDFACNKATAVQFIWMYIFAITANQGTYKLSPQVA